MLTSECTNGNHGGQPQIGTRNNENGCCGWNVTEGASFNIETLCECECHDDI